MGLLFLHHPWHCLSLDTTMTVSVMSNKKNSSSPQPLYRHTDGGNVPAFINYEDVDNLKKNRTIHVQSHLSCGSQEAPTDDANTLTLQVLEESLDNFSKSHIVEKLSDLSSPDDADATMSVSSDTTLEAESSGMTHLTLEAEYSGVTHLKTHDGEYRSLSLPKEGSKYVNNRSTCLSDTMLHMDTSNFITATPSIYRDDLKIDITSSARFSKVLENISLPLLYIPTTRQLVTGAGDGAFGLSQSGQSISSEKDLNVLYIPEGDSAFNCSHSSTLNVPSGELLSAQPPMAYSAEESHYMGSKYTDSDILTVNSTDSCCPVFHRTCEQSSHLFPDNSSLSSVSTGTDFSVSAISVSENDFNGESKSLSYDATDEAMFVDINLHSRNSFDKGYNSSSLDSGYGDKKAPSFEAPRKKSFTGFKNLFTKKVKDDSPPGWKLFGKVPPKPPTQSQEQIISEFADHQQKPVFLSTNKKLGSEVMSTTALILENRPINLPLKTPEETKKHRQQYEEMIEAAKRKELKDIKLKKKHLQQQRRLEDQMTAAARVWDIDVLPNWETMRSLKKTRDLWWMGLPPSVRGRVWQLAIGNDLNITHALYSICHDRAEERIRFVQEEGAAIQGYTSSDGASSQQEASNKESSVRVIKLDVSRTFPHLCIFQKGGPLFDLLHNLLGAYACYRPDVGYVQGMSFIAAILLLNMDVADAFVCFANLLNRPCQLAFFRMDENLMAAYYRTFEEFFKECLPRLYAHFTCLSVTPNLYLMEWVFLMYSKSLALDVACRVWDVFFRDGEEFLFRTALAILKIHESVLLKMDFIHAAQFLTKLPDDVSADELFKQIQTVKMTIDKRGYNAIHNFFRDLLGTTNS